MNKLIQELAEQADSYAAQTVHYYNGQFDAVTWERKFKQVRDTKFAELIISECANLVDGYVNERTFYFAGITIREHFGVEE